ncbi:MAG: hypothetical protein ACJZ4C_03015 [Candidatus Pelagibacter sp.]
MRKIIYSSFIFIIIIFISIVIYLSTVGVETDKFNQQISFELKKIDKNLNSELKSIKIILDPFELKFKIKTYGLKLKNKNKVIELENIQSKISIDSYLKNEFILTDLDISTKPIKIKELILFIRTFKKDPEFYVLEKFIKKGYFIADIALEFDSDGKIKNNYSIKGIIRDSQINFLNKYSLSNINFLFDINNKNFSFKDISLSFNNIKFLSKKINVKNLKDDLFFEGEFSNKDSNINKEFIKKIINFDLSKIDIKNIELESNNNFSFFLNKKYKINDLKIFSELKLNNLLISNKLELNKFLPNIKNEIKFSNHLIKIDYSNKKIIINGGGDLLLQDNKDLITYNIKNQKDIYEFEVSLDILENPLLIDFLNYQNDKDKKNIKLVGKHFLRKGTTFKNIFFNQNENKIRINDIKVSNDLKIKSFKDITLDFFDKDDKKNKISIIRKKNSYILSGPSFNINSLLDNLVNDDSKKSNNFLNDDFNLDLKIDKIYLDKVYVVQNLNGNLLYNNNEISKADLKASFPNGQKLNFTVQTNEVNKVTTLFLDQAEPIIKKYKFIKGFKGGSLDFYSSKTNKKSISTLKIYDFNLKELPALTKILTLASLQGIVDILSGEGIGFDEFEMNFQNQGDLMTIDEIYAIGPAISILMSGYVEKNRIISLRGTLVPATTINKAIGSIPVLGKILVGSKTGEGVFGVSFKIKGTPKKLETTVNPIKTLTPRFITRTLEKMKKN